MIDLAGATQACLKAASNPVLTSMGITTASYAQKSTWNMAVQGAYALLFPLIHQHFPSRIETQTFVSEYVQTSFLQHHAQNSHTWSAIPLGPGATVTMPSFALQGMMTFPVSTPIQKKGRPITPPVDVLSVVGGDDTPPVEIGIPQIEPIMALSISPALPYLTI